MNRVDVREVHDQEGELFAQIEPLPRDFPGIEENGAVFHAQEVLLSQCRWSKQGKRKDERRKSHAERPAHRPWPAQECIRSRGVIS